MFHVPTVDQSRFRPVAIAASSTLGLEVERHRLVRRHAPTLPRGPPYEVPSAAEQRGSQVQPVVEAKQVPSRQGLDARDPVGDRVDVEVQDLGGPGPRAVVREERLKGLRSMAFESRSTGMSALSTRWLNTSFTSSGTPVSEPQPHLRRLVDLSRMGWEPLRLGEDGSLEIAASCTVARLTRFGRGFGARNCPSPATASGSPSTGGHAPPRRGPPIPVGGRPVSRRRGRTACRRRAV